MKKPKDRLNWKTILGALGICTLVGGWMVTASVTADNKTGLKEVSEDVETLEEAMIRQTVMYESQQKLNVSQSAYNQDVAEILKNVRKK